MARPCPALPLVRAALALALTLASYPSGRAGEPPADQRFQPIPSGVMFETGDAWIVAGRRQRLYGVQACLRGTSIFTPSNGKKDCGEASLAMLVSLVRDLGPLCAVVARTDQGSTDIVTCWATPTRGEAKGSRIDLATALISTGFAFAALKPDATPVHTPYLVAELVAKRSRAGLWAFPDLPHPGPILLQAMWR